MCHPNIPLQVQGESHDTVSMHCANSAETAAESYRKLEDRFRSVNAWHTLSDKVKAKFTLFDGNTERPTTSLKEGNFIRIDVPGIGNPSGRGYDWTRITDIRTREENPSFPFLAVTIRPCSAPDRSGGTVAHFYNEESTNTFIIRKVGTCIYAEVHGRNEIENTSEVPVLDISRNKAVAIGGKLGLGKINWLGFTQALLEPFEN